MMNVKNLSDCLSNKEFYISDNEIKEFLKQYRNIDNKDVYATACILVSERHDKADLENLVYYLMLRGTVRIKEILTFDCFVSEDCGYLMEIDDFTEDCKNGNFINLDGFGQYASEDVVYKEIVYPSDVVSGNYNKRATHVMWYGK